MFMRRVNSSFKLFGFFVMLGLLGSFIISGCQKETPTESQLSSAVATEDAAQSISSSLSVNSGGAIEQIADMVNISSSAGLSNDASTMTVGGKLNNATITRTYDSTNGWWNATVTRERSNISGTIHSTYTRVYKYQYINANGAFQKNYITVNGATSDTAVTINHEIFSGTGYAVTPRIDHKLLSLTGKWIVTNANSDTVTFNSLSSNPYSRSSSDTVTTWNGMRTLNSSLVLNFTDVKGARGSGLNWRSKASGKITGTYHAIVSVLKGQTYTEKTIDRAFDITIGGTNPIINVNGKRFSMEPIYGEITAL